MDHNSIDSSTLLSTVDTTDHYNSTPSLSESQTTLEDANDQQTQDISPRSVYDIDAELNCVLQMVSFESFDGP